LANTKVIAAASQTLVKNIDDVLKEHFLSSSNVPRAALHDLHDPPISTSTNAAIVAVTLFEVREDPTSRNRPRVQKNKGVLAGHIDTFKPPMALKLRYLVTPWGVTSSNQGANERELEHELLGVVAQLFYERAILQFNPAAEETHSALKLSLVPLTFEEQTRFWHAVQQKFRASLTYDVRVVNLDAQDELSSPLVSSREIQYGTLHEP
jgi:hypothetical protein